MTQQERDDRIEELQDAIMRALFDVEDRGASRQAIEATERQIDAWRKELHALLEEQQS